MKKIFTLLTSLTLSISVFATDDISSMLTVRSNNKGDIKVVMDGKNFEPGFSSLIIKNIEPGLHSIAVYQEKKASDFSFWDSKYQVVYNSTISVEPATEIAVTIDRFGRTRVKQQAILNEQTINYGDHGYNAGSRINNDGINSSYNTVIAEKDFSFVLQSIQKEWAENNKMESAAHIIATNFFTTGQLKELLQLFSSDDNRLDLAKQAYERTVDQENYKCLSDILSSKNKIELEKYIQGCK